MKSYPKEIVFNTLVQQFQIKGSYHSANLINNGHIHNTYAVDFKVPSGQRTRYIFQEINHQVFHQPELVMDNIRKVTEYLQKVIKNAGGDPCRETITLIPTKARKYFYLSENGEYWRAMVFIEGACTLSSMPEPRYYTSASRAFGRFQKLLANFPVEELHTTIPNFHNTPARFAALVKAIETDPLNRAVHVKDDISFLIHREQDAGILIDLQNRGEMPTRVTHNDTKLDNVMMDNETGEGICVIDLDTVMPGLFLYDFGDTVRAAANTAAEDEPNLSKVHFNRPIYELLVRGYLEEMYDLITPVEMTYLAFGARLIVYEQAMRFLADYLNGDIYYRIHREHHNLERSRTQIKLLQEMETEFEIMNQIVKQYSSG